MTLSELKTLIQNYVENTETTFVNTLDDFIKNAEERIFELIQFDFFRKNVTGNFNNRQHLFNSSIRLSDELFVGSYRW